MRRRLTWPHAIYDFFQRRWLVAAVAYTLPGYVFIALDVAGVSLGLVDASGSLTGTAKFLFWSSIVVSLGIAIAKARADNVNEEAKRNGQFVLERMLKCVNAIKSAKLRRFCQYIERNKGRHGLMPFDEITQPRLQVERILEQIQIALSEMFGIEVHKIGLSVIFRLSGSAEWQTLYNLDADRDMTLTELIQNPDTTARQIIDGKCTSLFIADKRIGRAERVFVEGRRDKDHDGVGSIICRDISANTERRCMQAILSVTTYGTQICDAGDERTKRRIEESILPSFETRLRLELALLYVKEVLANPEPGEVLAT